MYEPPGDLVKRGCWFNRSGLSLRICISTKLPGDTDAKGSCITQEEGSTQNTAATKQNIMTASGFQGLEGEQFPVAAVTKYHKLVA